MDVEQSNRARAATWATLRAALFALSPYILCIALMVVVTWPRQIFAFGAICLAAIAIWLIPRSLNRRDGSRRAKRSTDAQ